MVAAMTRFLVVLHRQGARIVLRIDACQTTVTHRTERLLNHLTEIDIACPVVQIEVIRAQI